MPLLKGPPPPPPPAKKKKRIWNFCKSSDLGELAYVYVGSHGHKWIWLCRFLKQALWEKCLIVIVCTKYFKIKYYWYKHNIKLFLSAFVSYRLFRNNVCRKTFIINLQIFRSEATASMHFAKKSSLFCRLLLEQESRTWPSEPCESLIVCGAMVSFLREFGYRSAPGDRTRDLPLCRPDHLAAYRAIIPCRFTNGTFFDLTWTRMRVQGNVMSEQEVW